MGWRRAATGFGLILTSGVLAFSVEQSGALPVKGSCTPRGSVTLARTKQSRVYRRVANREASVYGCVFRRRLSVALTAPREDGSLLFPPPALRLRGTVVAYAYSILGYDEPGATLVRVEDLRLLNDDPNQGTGLSLVDAGLPGDEALTTVFSLVMSRHGAIAWTGCRPSIDADGRNRVDPCRAPGRTTRFVMALPRKGHKTRRLDAGRAIDPRSLRLRDTHLTWTNRGRAKEAALR